MGVGLGVFPSDADHGVVFFSVEVGIWAEWVFPRGSFFKSPPLPDRVFFPEFDRFGRSGENDGAGDKHFGRSFGEFFGGPSFFGLGHVVCSVDEFLKLGVRDFMDVDKKPGDGDWVDGAFFGVVWEFWVFGGAAGVSGTFDPDHVIRSSDWIGKEGQGGKEKAEKLGKGIFTHGRL